MPLKKGASIGENIREFHKGATFARTARKFGKGRANKQAIAVAFAQRRKSKGSRRTPAGAHEVNLGERRK